MSENRVLDASEYPRRWSEYIGQETAKAELQVAAKSARIRKEPLDHVLIAHPTAGIGKTALAMLLAREMRTQVRVMSGAVSRDEARIVLAEMNDRDVLFYDEFHQVMDNGKRQAEAWLLTYLQDALIPGPLGMEEYPRVTLVAATTEAACIPKTIRSRFTYLPVLTEYTDEQAAKIAVVLSKKLLTDMPTLRMPDALLLAAAAHNNPRAIKQLLKRLRDMVVTDMLPCRDGRYDIAGLLAFQGITPDGLDRPTQVYLTTLADEFAGHAGAKALQDRLQYPGGLAEIEQVLMDKGLVARTRTGRTLTKAGILRTKELAS